MKSFATLHRAALKRKGENGLAELLPDVKSPTALRRLKDATALSEMGKAVMRAGFYWRVVEQKWPSMTEVFVGFEPSRVARFNDLDLGQLLDDDRVIRHRKKLGAIRDNARFVVEVAEEHGSFGRFLASWPANDPVGLWLLLKKRGARLGGNTGAWFLRSVGFDTFLITHDTTQVLIDSGVVDKEPKSQRDLRAAQEAFLAWQQESGLPLAHISRILSCSVAR